MATPPDLVAPFRGERYRASDRLSRVIAPPYDVILPDQRPGYAARDEHNIVHLMLPEAAGGKDKYRHAADLLTAWREAGVLVRDPSPAVYVMAQGFTLPTGERRTRTGMFAAVAAEGYGPRRIRPHERTHRGPKADRLALLRATHTNLEAIFLLAPDHDGVLAAGLRSATAGPAHATATLDGVDIALWAVEGDPSPLPLPPAPLYIADGHHRFETTCAFLAERGKTGRLLAFVTSARDDGLVALPTHRIVFGAGRGSLARLVERWRQEFEVTPLAPSGDPLARLAAVADRTACAVLGVDGQEFLLTLKPDADLSALAQSEADATVRDLDVARIEHLVVREIIGAAESTVTLDYTADAGKAIEIARAGRAAAVAVLVPPTPVERVLAVADAGGVMPPKSTYFVPKVPSGVVLLPLLD
jgi:uncharacterized protein (DUF1015 family)